MKKTNELIKNIKIYLNDTLEDNTNITTITIYSMIWGIIKNHKSKKININFFLDRLKIKDVFTRNIIKKIDELFLDNDLDPVFIRKKLYTYVEKEINQKKTGTFYTPEYVVNFITTHSIDLYLLNYLNININKEKFIIHDILLENIKKLSNTDRKKLVNKIKNIKIIDPTCGSGAFLESVFKYFKDLSDNYLYGELSNLDIINIIYGIDINEDAINVSKFRLLELSEYSDKIQNIIENNIINENLLLVDNERQKYDIVIGNPPFFENFYENSIFRKRSNIYMHIIEKIYCMIKEISVIGYIVPISLFTTERMSLMSDYIVKQSELLQISYYADRPGCLFTGVHQRLLIFFSLITNNKKKEIMTSGYNMWYTKDEKKLFKNNKYINIDKNDYKNKLSNSTEKNILKKINKGDISILDCLSNTNNDNYIYLSKRIGFWVKCFYEKNTKSNEYAIYYLKDRFFRILFLSLFNSSIFYFYWITKSDCWHLTKKDIAGFKIPEDRLKLIDINKLEILNIELMESLERNKVLVNSKQVDFEYKHKYSKEIIDKIDYQLSILFDLNESEISYIAKYKYEFRMNKENKK